MSARQRSRRQQALELSSIVIAATLSLALGARVLQAASSLDAWWMLPLSFVLGLASADLVSGVAHWIGDRFFREETPVLGPALIHPFREHHRDPMAITSHDFLELHGNSCPPGIVALGVALLAPVPASLAALALQSWLLFLATLSMATNQIHVWAHADRVHPAVRRLQGHGLILSPERHAAHHEGDFSTHYCITTGWWNPLLDRLGVLRKIERGVRGYRGRA